MPNKKLAFKDMQIGQVYIDDTCEGILFVCLKLSTERCVYYDYHSRRLIFYMEAIDRIYKLVGK
jgi:hypothetical protein